MKSKILPAVVAFAIISSLNTCHKYQVKRESKIGRAISEMEQKFDINDYDDTLEEEKSTNNSENTTYSKGK